MKFKVLLFAAFAGLCCTRQAKAIPVLQLYLEGATYNATTESWEVTAAPGDPLRLWTIGAVGRVGTISDVRLSIAYDSSYTGATLGLTSQTTGGLGGVTDPSTPDPATYLQTVTDGSTPLLGSGDPLAPHGIYGPGTTWQEFALGDFSLTDSPIGDFITTFPTTLDKTGQVNVYEVSVSGSNLEGLVLHFDLYNHVEAGNHVKYKFAPFSHDGDGVPGDDGGGGGGGGGVVPEPSSLALLGGAIGLAGLFSRRRKQI